MPIDLVPSSQVEAERSQYHAYLKDLDNRILRVRLIVADNEEEALRQLYAMMDGRPLELWKDADLLARLDAMGNRKS